MNSEPLSESIPRSVKGSDSLISLIAEKTCTGALFLTARVSQPEPHFVEINCPARGYAETIMSVKPRVSGSTSSLHQGVPPNLLRNRSS